jgi:anti-anti-sigma factor
MDLNISELENGIRRIALVGRLDMQSSLAIDTRFTALTATGTGPVLVDMSGVEFIASIGIRLLLSNAKALAQAGRAHGAVRAPAAGGGRPAHRRHRHPDPAARRRSRRDGRPARLNAARCGNT